MRANMMVAVHVVNTVMMKLTTMMMWMMPSTMPTSIMMVPMTMFGDGDDDVRDDDDADENNDNGCGDNGDGD